MNSYIRLLRPHHYVKNLLVFAALACSGELLDLDKLWRGVLGFVAFCMVSSAVYIVNDIQDREKDRCHPTKCNRPIASGAVPVKKAVVLAGVLLVISAVCSYLTGCGIYSLFLVLYFGINLGYSFGLKNLPILDVTILAAGFLIRILYGAFITETIISNWLYLTVIAFAFYFSLGKRRNECKRMPSGETREVLKAYPISFLDKSTNMCLTLGITFYALWSMDEHTVASYGQYPVFTVPVVLLIVMKYSLNVEGNQDGDPVEVLFHDIVLLIFCLLYLVTMLLVLYSSR